MTMRKKVEHPDEYRRFKAQLRGYYDKNREDDDPADAEVVWIAAPTLAAAEMFVCTSGLYRYLDASYSMIQQTTKAKHNMVDIIVDAEGKVQNSDRPMHEYPTVWSAAAVPHTVYAKTLGYDSVIVLNPGDAQGKAWVIRMKRVYDGEEKFCVVEGESAEKALSNFATHPYSYPVRVNPLDDMAHLYAQCFEAGEALPARLGNDPLRLKMRAWMSYDGQLHPDPDHKLTFRQDIGQYGGQTIYDELVSFCVADFNPEMPYELPSHRIVSSKVYADPPECSFCEKQAQEGITNKARPEAVYCSTECDQRHNGKYMLLPTYKGSAMPKTDPRPVYGPVTYDEIPVRQKTVMRLHGSNVLGVRHLLITKLPDDED